MTFSLGPVVPCKEPESLPHDGFMPTDLIACPVCNSFYLLPVSDVVAINSRGEVARIWGSKRIPSIYKSRYSVVLSES